MTDSTALEDNTLRMSTLAYALLENYEVYGHTEDEYELGSRDTLIEYIGSLENRVAELEADSVQIQYINEDELPKPISYKVYSAMFGCSKVDFVRLFPYVTIDDRKLFLIELPEVVE